MTDGIQYYGVGDVYISNGVWKNFVEVKFDTADHGIVKMTYNKENGIRQYKDSRLTDESQNEYVEKICSIVWMITFETDKKEERFK